MRSIIHHYISYSDNSLIDAPSPSGGLETRGNKEGEPKLIVTSRTHNSVSSCWDDFSADNPDRGYVAEYREIPSVNIPTEIPWMKKEALREEPPPTMTIDLLKPNTLYEVRVGIYSQAAERRLTAATETITVRTEPGCVYGNTSFPVGDFFQGCEERCSCTKDGSVKCSGRCTIPYFNKGSFANDPLCSEITEEGDECCVLVMCAHGGSSDYDQCANTVCGKNAECVSLHSLTEVSHTHNYPPPGSCRCKEGFSGDPADHEIGCVADPAVADDSNNCNFRLNHTVQVMFTTLLLQMHPRCQYSANETLEEVDSSCSLIPDPEDQCCKIRVCNSTSNTEVSPGPSPALDFDGCIYRNKSYTKNEAFTFGCDSKCLCMGFGDVSCYPRCPPIKDAPAKREGVMCETLIDPEDECCNVTGTEDEDVFIGNFTSAADVEEAKSLHESLDMLKAENTTEEGDMSVSEMLTSNSTSLDEKDETNMFNMTVVENMNDNEHKMNETKNETHKGFDWLNDERTNKTMMEENDEMMNETSSKTMDHIDFEKHFGLILDHEPEVTTMFDEGGSDNWTADEGRSNIFTEDHKDIINETDNLMKKARFEDIMIPHLEIGDIMPLDSSTVKVTLKVSHEVLASLLSSASEHLIVSYSHDSLRWTNKTIPVGSVDVENMYDIIFKVPDLEEYDAYQFKVYYKELVSPTKKVSLASSTGFTNSEVAPRKVMICHFKGKDYNAGEDFYDECEHYCQCTENLTVNCRKIECPARFGLRIMDPGCLEWEDDPSYVPTPPKCCGQKPKCALHIDHLACEHMGKKFQHLDFIPKEMVGCDQRCQCLSGQLDCENLCPPVTASPPFHLECERHLAKIVTVTGYPCCREWQCTNYTDLVDYETHPGIIPGTHFLPPIAPEPQLSLIDVTDITEHSVRIIFLIDDTFIGLPGGLYLRYTSHQNPDPNSLHWESEIIHKEGVVLSRKDWDYIKKDLDPDTNYTMQLVLLTPLKKAEIVSKKFTVTTAMKTTTPLPRLDLDAELEVSEIKNTSAKISWKHFTDYELQYIDGIRFPLEGPMLHREADNMILRDLDPDKSYTVDLFFIPHQGLTSTISNTKNITFRTLPKPKDKYAFNITIHPGKITKKGVQVMYSGVPEPEGKFINVYRVVYTSDGDSQDSQKFKVPKAQKDGFITITDLKPGVEYEVWLEAYLTNGSKKKSNVITIKTEPGELPVPEKSELGEPDELKAEPKKSYYSAFVTLAVIVTLAGLVILGLIVLLLRRQSQAKAHINSSKTAYDNPSYKTSESSGFAMEMNGLKSTTNGSSRTEEP
ncbi:putative epidermal cell surface receptor [Armadillidium vulgare]|nr:putative epidermal cell surface receptor [Armadillidium vulgare]